MESSDHVTQQPVKTQEKPGEEAKKTSTGDKVDKAFALFELMALIAEIFSGL